MSHRSTEVLRARRINCRWLIFKNTCTKQLFICPFARIDPAYVSRIRHRDFARIDPAYVSRIRHRDCFWASFRQEGEQDEEDQDQSKQIR